MRRCFAGVRHERGIVETDEDDAKCERKDESCEWDAKEALVTREACVRYTLGGGEALTAGWQERSV